MASEARTLTAVRRHTAQRQSITLELLKALLGLWGGFNDFDDPLLVHGKSARSATLTDVALSRIRRSARSYATAVLRDHDAMPRGFRPQVDLYPRSGATMTSVYSRPARTYAWEVYQGHAPSDALTQAKLRMKQIAEADVAAAERDELNALWQMSSKTIGWRRIIHPERSATGTCGLCIVAATRLYSMDELKELHGGCECTELPVFAGSDPGLKLNQDDLKAIYAAAGSTSAEDLRNTRVTVREHGELGPILVLEGDQWRDVTEVNRNARGREFTPYERPTRENQSPVWEKTIRSSQAAIAGLKTAIDDPSTTAVKARDYAAAIRFHTDLIARLTAKLR